MEQPEFERAVLQMAHHGGVSRLTPSAVAYQVRVSAKDAERMLDKMVTNAQLELDSDDDGNLFYFVPGLGTPGVFTSGTAAANPIEPPKPPEPAPGPPYAPYGQSPTGNPYGQYGQPQSAPQPSPYPGGTAPPQQQQYGQPYGQPPASSSQYGQPPAAPYGQPPTAAPYGAAQQQYGQPGPPPYGGQSYPQPPQYGQPPQNGQPPQHGQPPQYGQPMNAYGQPYGYGQNALVPQGSQGPKSPAASALLSAMIPGAGQLYNGQVGKGLAFFFISLLMVSTPPMLFVPWMWGIIDAYNSTRRQNAQQHYGLLNP